ncbi:ABC transporter ATP-binding protein [Enterococcus casseliflavus]|uniref:ABC transporter ATP-binding protein n=1 Tax=Enterococcus casseliflavus TaxID=37734 RepID=UPI00115C6CE3|nr:ABC transporter ATP-binding protein [Enterococcus casseliflavus]
MTEVLALQNASKLIGTKRIIDDVSFVVDQGQVVGLLGPNGAGKTTIIRMIVGLMKHNTGSIAIMGNLLDSSFKTAIASVGVIVENPEFYNYMTGYENLMQYQRMAKKKGTASELEALIRQVHLEGHIHQKVKTYSLGMRQRLGVAQALVHQPDLLVLDEPMNGLDPKGMREFREMILSLRAKGVSVLVSSHQLSDIEQIADHLIVVQKGKVTHQVAMAELKAEKNVLIIKTDDNLQTEALLKASFEVEVLQVEDEMHVTLQTDQRSEIAAAIVTAGIGLKELRTKQSSLEDTFLAWTEEGGL